MTHRGSLSLTLALTATVCAMPRVSAAERLRSGRLYHSPVRLTPHQTDETLPRPMLWLADQAPQTDGKLDEPCDGCFVCVSQPWQ